MMNELTQKYFNDPQKVISFKKNALLFNKGDTNPRLYLVESGTLKGFDPDDQGEYFHVNQGEFIGLFSFFSKSLICQMSVIAMEDCRLRYIEENIYDLEDKQMPYDFMPVVIDLLLHRQKQIHHAHLAHQDVLNKMKDVERLASLGQLSAGVAHELNNAITVIARGSKHISDEVIEQFCQKSIEKDMIMAGLINGRIVSSGEARKLSKELSKESNLSQEQLRDYARTGMAEKLIKENEETAQRAFELWNLGATIHDLQSAVKQAEHVVHSMRSLASTNVIRQDGCNLNESIEKALFLLSNPLNNCVHTCELNDIPTVFGNSGELVQIWSNLVKNAIDAMEDIPQAKSFLSIKSSVAGDNIKVTIKDSGSGIPKDMQQEVFKPHVTTKNTGQTFGLGLGLTIVPKIINRYSGELSVDSSSEGTTFTVLIPIGEKK